MIYLTKRESPSVPYSRILSHFGWSRSGFYRWLKKRETALLHGQEPSRKDQICQEILDLFERSGGTYGSPRIHQSLKALGYSVFVDTVANYMRAMGLRAVLKKRFKIKTTDSQHNHPISQRRFRAEDPKTMPQRCGEVFAGDITYLKLLGGTVIYLAVVMDIYSRKIVGWSLGSTMETSLVLDALEKALEERKKDVQIIFHSDRGSQYASKVYRDILEKNQVLPSMSRRGNCYDNAFVESFFSTLKKEFIYRNTFEYFEDVRFGLFKFIEVWYNRNRLHSALGYQTPVEWEDSLSHEEIHSLECK